MIMSLRMPMRFAGLLLCASAPSLQPTAAGIQEPARTQNGLLSGIAGADQMSSYRVNFAAAGNPNGQGLPPWPAYDAHSDIPLRLGVSIEPRTRPDGARLDFFDSLVAQQRAN